MYDKVTASLQSLFDQLQLQKSRRHVFLQHIYSHEFEAEIPHELWIEEKFAWKSLNRRGEAAAKGEVENLLQLQKVKATITRLTSMWAAIHEFTYPYGDDSQDDDDLGSIDTE
ncbi:hypothetical protein DFQ28_004320 [Apophysomyces sp. BC1034]|nr:hypothetical protein DFQ30_004358 [Apophysomyces sp. BC1015]KAG0178419.1 hypothetical protein DFQ29_003490 [Apophysomyces sp. BC1021]KAG0188827.1 hypothetical protein DFQ28_004320 [Apophysomyces sp. BC1034]